MRKKVIFTVLIIIISFISFNKTIFAEEYSSGIMPKSNALSNVEIGKIHIESFGFVKHFTTSKKKGDWIEITTHFSTEYGIDTKIIYTLTLYNQAQEQLGQYVDELDILTKSGGAYSRRIETFVDGYDVDDVTYYKVDISVPLEAQVFDGAEKGAYFLEDFVTYIKINENNVYDINQTFMAKFKGSSRAINYRIPFRHKYVRSDGTKVSKRAVITDLKVSDDFERAIEKGINLLTVGMSDPSITMKDYDFSYSYNVGKDKLDGNDELVVYLVRDLEVEVDGLSFAVQMPKDFDEGGMAFIDSDGNVIDDVEYTIEDNLISGRINSVLKVGQNCALRIILPDGYFVGASSNISDYTIRAFVVPIIFLVLTMFICLISKRKKNIINEKVGLYIGEDIDSFELGYILKDGVKETDISSLIFGLANKKYIEIDLHDDNYTITKNKEYIGEDKLEEILMKRLFQENSIVTRKDLKDNLKNVKDEMVKSLKYRKKNRFYIHPIVNYKLLFLVMIFIIYYLNMNNLLFEYQPNFLLLTSVVGFIGFLVLLEGVLSKKYQMIEKVLSMMAGITIIVSPIVLTSYGAFEQDSLYVEAYVVGIISIISIAILNSLLSDRTMKGNYLYRKIVAYKSYLAKVSEEVLAEEMTKNDKYFYEVLPYVLVMGISDSFVEKFKNLGVEEPVWFETNNFNLDVFYEQIINIYSDFYLALKNK